MSLAILSEPIPLATDAHGVVRVGGTRITLDVVISAYLRGEGPESISESYPTISLADIHAVISYYLRHKEEVEEYLEAGRLEAEEIRRHAESRFGVGPGRAELLARQRK